jgi:uncharacterized integral membrane protein
LSLLTSGATNPTGPDNAADVAALAALNPLSLLGCAAFGLSLTQIHIYVTEIKRAIQVRAGQGVGGSVVQQCVVSLNRLHPLRLQCMKPQAPCISRLGVNFSQDTGVVSIDVTVAADINSRSMSGFHTFDAPSVSSIKDG